MNREAAIAELVEIQLDREAMFGDVTWMEFLATLPDNRDRAMAEMIRNDREKNGQINRVRKVGVAARG